jgi:hypothetical protein
MIIINNYSHVIPELNRWYSIVEISEKGEKSINAYWKLKPSFSINNQKEFRFDEHAGVMPLTEKGLELLKALPYAYKDNHYYYTEVFLKPSHTKSWGTQRAGILD